MSTPTPDPAQTTGDTGSSPEATEKDAAYWQAEAEKWKANSRKNEADKKANASKIKEYEDWKASQLSEHEKALNDAREEGASAVRAEYAAKLAESAFKGAAKGRIADVDSVLSKLNVAQFLTDSGDVDESAITAFIDAIAPVQPESTQQPQTDPMAGLFQAQGAVSQSNALPLNGDPLLQRVNQILGIK